MIAQIGTGANGIARGLQNLAAGRGFNDNGTSGKSGGGGGGGSKTKSADDI